MPGNVRVERAVRATAGLGTLFAKLLRAASKTKNTYLAAQFRRLSAARGIKRAGHCRGTRPFSTLAITCCSVGPSDEDLGPNYFDQRHKLRTTKRLVKRLEALGHKVVLESTLSSASNEAGA